MDQAGSGDRMFDDSDGLMIDGAITQAVEVLFAAGGIIAVDRMGHFIQVEAEEHRAESQAMVAVEVADEDASDSRRRNIGKDEIEVDSDVEVRAATMS